MKLPVHLGDICLYVERQAYSTTPSWSSDGAQIMALERVYDAEGGTVGFVEYVGRPSCTESRTEYGWRPLASSRSSLTAKRDAIRALLGSPVKVEA